MPTEFTSLRSTDGTRYMTDAGERCIKCRELWPRNQPHPANDCERAPKPKNVHTCDESGGWCCPSFDTDEPTLQPDGALEAVAVQPLVIRVFEGQSWVPLTEAVRLHEAHQRQ